MKKKNLSGKMRAMVMAALMLPVTADAQNKNDVEVYFDTDVVSHYMWRGQDKAGVSIQPTFYISWKGLTLRADGSTGFDRSDITDIDLTLGYEKYGFNVGIIDYWTSGIDPHNRYFYYSREGAHQLEANIGYICKYGKLQAYTTFWGNDFKVTGKRAYSTYIELSVPFTFGGLDWEVAAGMTPFESAGEAVPVTDEDTNQTRLDGVYYYAGNTACVMASARVTKSLDLGFITMPVFAEFHANPYLQTANFLVGVTIKPF